MPPAEAKPADEPPKEEEWKPPSIDVGAWIRVGLQFTSTRTAKIDDTAMDSAYGELHLRGKVHPNLSYTLNFNANGAGGTPTAGLLDAIVGLDFLDELHLWSGQLLTPVDRSNFSGPFFMSPWSYPGIMSAGGNTVFITPNGETTFGRDVGTVLWGDVMKGMFKYYLAMTHLRPVSDSPLFSGRLAFAAIGKEPGYYGSSTYYGDQDILAIGVGGQYQNDGSVLAGTPGNPTAVPPVPATPTQFDKYGEVNADVLAEFKIGEAGVITGEGAFYHYEGDYNLADNQFFLLASYLTPPVGPGKIQPLVRYQNAKKDGIDAMWQIDGQVAYVVKGAAMRGLLGFSHTDLVGIEGNLFQIGLQTIMF